MYHLLFKLIVGATILQLGLNLTDSRECSSRACVARIERASRKALEIAWKPISVFPDEVRKFR